jgi:hypothetical protein
MKKNIRKIPENVRTKLKSLRGKDIVAGCAIEFSAKDIRAGLLNHLGIEFRKDGLYVPSRFIPPPLQGKYSEKNVHGEEIVRRDLGLVTRYRSIEAPNWGSSSNGTHSVDMPYPTYIRDFIPPRGLELVLHCNDCSAVRTTFSIAVHVDEVLSQGSFDFEHRLLVDLNLIQENLGSCGVEVADMSVEDYVSTLHLSWEILPPGSREEAIERLFKGRKPTRPQMEVAESRLQLFDSLKPQNFVVGSSGFSRYFGALLEEGLVVFENLQYGNAIYVMYENWQKLSSQNRLDLLSGRLGESFDRVIHKQGWELEVKMLVDDFRQLKKMEAQRGKRK